MEESKLDIPVGAVPESWWSTPEITNWLALRDFPFDSVENMVTHARTLLDDSAPFRLIDDNFPQSYAHWWCHCRMAVIQNKEPIPIYGQLQKWQGLLHTDGKKAPTVIFGTLELWLDMLALDVLLFSNEKQRESVPRIDIENHIVTQQTERALQSRKKTMQYLIREGGTIFKERGWTDGYNYWVQKCRKYLI
jgi:hypothetical protein